ncbi:MAG: hypothetical protein ACI83O_000592 [Patescibacteria group bacterium]|jgi:hypothetical protein
MVVKKKSVKKDKAVNETRISSSFVNILAVLSIMGFVGIISVTLFGRNIDAYVESIWLIFMGFGFIIESSPIQLYDSIHSKMTNHDFSSMTTFIVGLMAVLASILSFPGIDVQSVAFDAIKGVISIIAILFIIVQTWVIK